MSHGSIERMSTADAVAFDGLGSVADKAELADSAPAAGHSADEVNAAVKRHLSATDLSFVIVAKDAKALADALVTDGPSTVSYEAEKPAALLEEDRVIGATKLGIRPEAVRITKIDDVFAR